MASAAVQSRLESAKTASTSEKPQAYSALLESILKDSPQDELSANLSNYARTLLDESLGIVVLRPLVTNFVHLLRSVKNPEVKIDVGNVLLELLEPKGAQFEEQDAQTKHIVADAYEEDGDYVKTAQTLQRLPLDSTQKQLSSDDKAKVWIRIVRCYLQEDDTTSAFTYLNKVKNVIHEVTNKETRIHFQLSQARIYDAQRSFLDAAQAYHTVSLDSFVDEEDRLQALSAAFVCAILAPAGPQRAKVLAKFHKDERANQVEHFTILEKVFFERIVYPEEVKAFAAQLQEHHLAKTADGSTVLERAIFDQNILGVSKIYQNIGVDRLAEILGTDADKAEELAARMLEQGRIAGHIDQIDRWIFFEGVGSGERKTGHAEKARTELHKWDANVQGLAEDVEKVATMIQNAQPDFYAAQTEQQA